MNRRSILVIVLLNVLSVISALAQAPVIVNPGPRRAGLQKSADTHTRSAPPQSKEADAKKRDARQSLTSFEARLVSGSKTAILETGISEPYFETHFKLVTAIDKTGDRRVVWKFSINEYEATLNDAVGYYTSDGGDRIDVHSIKDILGSAHDIEKTIPRKQAEKRMRECIGRFTNPSVVFKALTGNASLLMIASSAGKNPSKSEEREREEKRKQESGKRASKSQTSELDAIKQEENERGGPSYFGMVNLETGKCTKGKAVIVP